MSKNIILLFLALIISAKVLAIEVTIGNGDEEMAAPLCEGWKNAMFECIYFPDELGTEGMITGLKLYNSSGTGISRYLQIYLMNSSSYTLEPGMISSLLFTSVFNGGVQFPGGSSTISVDFQIPFYYTGDNLTLLIVKPFDWSWGPWDLFFASQTGYGSRCRFYGGDDAWGGFYPETPPAGTLTNQFPKTTFIINPLQPVAYIPNFSDALYPLNSQPMVPTSTDLRWNWPELAYGAQNYAQGFRINLGTDYPPTNVAYNQDMANQTAYNPVLDLEPETKYYWQVVPYNIIGDAEECPIWSFTTEPQQIKVISPNGGENWRRSTNQTVLWTAPPLVNTVNISISVNNGSTWTPLNTVPIASSLGYFTFSLSPITSSQCLIKVEDSSSPVVNDVSDSVFSISTSVPSSLTLSNPPTYKIQSGKTCEIQWSANGIETIRLDYSYDQGVSWQEIASELPISAGSYTWNIPNHPIHRLILRGSSVDNSMYYDVNNEPYVVKQLEIVKPNGSELYQTGRTRAITWKSSYVENIKIEASSDNGNSWSSITASTNATDKYYNWQVPLITGIQNRVRVVDLEENTVIDVSDSMFNLSSLELTYPSVSNLTLQAGYASTVTWTQTNLPGTIKIQISYNNGNSFITLASGIDATLGTWTWIVNDTPSTTCRIQIVSENDYRTYDISDYTFTIAKLELTSPTGSEVWGSGSVHPITWIAANVSSVKIDYSIDNGLSWSIITESTPALSGSFDWALPLMVSSQYIVKISNAQLPNITDTSAQIFEVIEGIVVLTPNGGEALTVGSFCDVAWNITDDIPFVKLDYSVDNGTSWIPIQALPYPSGWGVFGWEIPNTPSDSCLVRIVNSDNENGFGMSDNVFRISSTLFPPSVNFTANNTSGYAPLSVQFTDLSVAGTGSIIGWSWQFGDGGFSLDQHPQHTFEYPGTYSVSLSVTNSADSTSTLTRTDFVTALQRTPEIELSDDALNFGNVYLGSHSEALGIWVRNIGSQELVINSFYYFLSSHQFQLIDQILPISIPISDSVFIQLLYVPTFAGSICDSLYIHSDAVNFPVVAFRLMGIGEYVPPKPPENVAVIMDGYDAVITWDAVTQTIFDTPITPDFYLVFFNGSSDPEPDSEYYFLAISPTLSYTHLDVGQFSPHMFYRVIAYVNYDNRFVDFTNLGIVRGMPECEVLKRLK